MLLTKYLTDFGGYAPKEKVRLKPCNACYKATEFDADETVKVHYIELNSSNNGSIIFLSKGLAKAYCVKKDKTVFKTAEVKLVDDTYFAKLGNNLPTEELDIL